MGLGIACIELVKTGDRKEEKQEEEGMSIKRK